MILYIVISKSGVRNFIKDQIALVGRESEVSTFVVDGRFKYIRAIFQLMLLKDKRNIKVVHGHYSLTYPLMWFLGRGKVRVLSLMGTDVFSKHIVLRMLRVAIRQDKSLRLIVKSEIMGVGFNNFVVVPNSVSDCFFEPPCDLYRREEKIKVLFPADPQRPEKNYDLLHRAIRGRSDIRLSYFDGIPHTKVKGMYREADVVILTSHYEGSPNVIKEAFAMSKLILCTNVGDVKDLFENVGGTILLEGNDEDKIITINKVISNVDSYKQEIDFQQRKNRLSALGLEEYSVLHKLLEIYKPGG